MALSYDLKLYLLHFGGSFVIPRPHCSGLMVFNHVNHLMLWTLRKSGLRVTQSHCHYICFCYYNFVYTSSLFLYDLCFVTFWCRCCAVAAQTNKYKYVNINEMPFVFVCLSAGYNIKHLDADESKALLIQKPTKNTHPHTDTCMHSGSFSLYYQRNQSKGRLSTQIRNSNKAD